MGKDILIRDQIFSTYDSLYDAEKKVADYVAGHQEDVINMSVAELAHESGYCDSLLQEDRM